MNLIVIPYHDWRKINTEGARTRDAHFLGHLAENDNIETLIIINRPLTYLELGLKKKFTRIDGTPILSKNGCTLYQLSERKYIIDFLFLDLLGPVIKKKKWFFESFGEKKVVAFINECLAFLKVENFKILNQNIFSAQLNLLLREHKSVFDAWDNFILFPDNINIEDDLVIAYTQMYKSASKWITNSIKNIEYFGEKFNVKDIELIKNGVDFEKFQKEYPKPDDLSNIPTPIIGFGGKITHLFDYELFNYCLSVHSDKSFVVVGQILNRDIFDKIDKAPNFYYLGDKNYEYYPAYVCSFDVGIIPYVNNHLDSGADTIKAYEYLAANLNAVGTLGAGMTDHINNMHIASDKEEFSAFINLALRQKGRVIVHPIENSWKYKTEQLVKILIEL